MSTSDAITAAVAACAVIITLLMLVGAIQGVNPRVRLYRAFFAMLLFNLAGSCCEMSLPLLFGRPGKAVSALIRVIDFADYACGGLVFIAFVRYLYEYLSAKGRVSRKPFAVMAGIYAFNIPLLAAAQFNGMFAYLDDLNRYHARDAMWMTMVFPTAAVIMTVVVMLRYFRAFRVGRREWISLMLYAIIPLVCYAIEFAVPGLWVSYMGSTVALLLIYINIQVALSQRMKAQEAQMIESRVAVMLSQIQPHFLVNSLLAIHDLNKRDHAAANSAIYSFSEYLRGNMDALNLKRNIPFEDELRHARTYLSLEKLRFEDNLRVAFDITARAFSLPPLTLQPIVENAVRHGVTKREEGGTVTISAHEREAAFVVTVADDGVGFDPARIGQDGGRHVGIENTRSRLAALCGGSLEIQSVKGAGTRAVITLPKEVMRHEYPDR